MSDPVQYVTLNSPVGILCIAATVTGICSIDIASETDLQILIEVLRTKYGADFVFGNHPFLRKAEQQFFEYFDGNRKIFDIPLDLIGTDFQKRVWTELMKIPYGQTISYRDLSAKLGNVKAIRAVAAANGANPLPIVVPCHRVIGANGKLVGYSGGLWRKEFLLRLERFIPSVLF